jgi:PilZ domain-containing protein
MRPMKKNGEDQRAEERIGAAWPVDLGASTGVTCDVSASGMFFETDATYALGNEVTFAVDLATPCGKLTLRCQGSIVRLEPREHRVGVAVKITASKLEVPRAWQTPEGSVSRIKPVE